jgi:hypothetical protein
MGSAPGLAGTTVTIFGDSRPLDHALSEELNRRGCSTHYVSVPTGWLRSVTHAVVRLDTAAGAAAIKQLATTEQPRSHVVAVCAEPNDVSESERVNEMCRACGMHHDVSLIWHPALATVEPPPALPPANAVIAADALASTVADEMAERSMLEGPSFVARPFVPRSPFH